MLLSNLSPNTNQIMQTTASNPNHEPAMNTSPILKHVRHALVRSILFVLALTLVAPTFGASQLINLHFSANPYTGSTETSPATPTGPAGTWNNLTNTVLNGVNSHETDGAVVLLSDGSPGPTLALDISSTTGAWSGSSLTTVTVDYTTASGVYNVASLYESGLQNSGNNVTGFRLKGLAPGTYQVYVVPMFRSAQAAGVKADAAVTFSIGLGNDTDARNTGNHALTSTAASPTQNIDTRFTSWVASTDGSTAYNYIGATVAIDSTNRWLTILLPDSATSGPDRTAPCVIQIKSDSGGCTPPTIDTQPAAQTGCVGDPVQFAVAATGTTLTYQWRRNGTNLTDGGNISGATTTNLVINPIGTGDAATAGAGYDCVVTESGTCSSTSQRVALTVNSAPAITDEPDSVGVTAGSTANFNLTATGGTLSYQWEISTDSGFNWAPVSSGTGGTTNSYTTAATTTGDSGNQYRCIVTGVCGLTTVTSSVATLTVTCDTAGITTGPVDSAVPEGFTANFAVTATGSSRTYSWEVSTDGGTVWNPTGGSATSYTTPATSALDNGNKYRCIVSVACDSSSVTSSVATLTVVGANAAFRSMASGRWQDASTWELSGDGGSSWFPAGVTPTSANSTNILIAAGTTVANLGSTTADQIVVAAGGTLNVSNTLTVAAGSTVDLDVQGTLVVIGGSSALTLQSGVAMVVESGGVFAHDGTSSAGVNNSGSITIAAGGTFQLRRAGGNIPISTWAPGSTCEIAYSTASSSRPGDAGTAQTFENFVWNNPLQSAGVDLAGKMTNVNGNFILVASAGQEVKWSGDANFGGNIIVSNGVLNVSGNATPRIWTLKGDLIIAAGGSFNVSATASATNQLILNGTGTQNYTCDGVNLATKLFWTVDSGSTLNLNSDLALTSGGRILNANGTVNLNGKTLATDRIAGTGTIRNQGGGTGLLLLGAGNATDTLGTTPSLVNGASGTLGLGKSGSGVLTITDTQIFSGGLVVSNGTVLVNNASGSGTGSGNVTVAGGTLGGTGTISGSVNVESAGNLAPGASIGDLTINGTLTLGGTFTAEVDTGAAPNTDRSLGTSAKNYGGTLQIQNLGAPLTASDTFQIFPAGTRSGVFGGIIPATPDNNAGLVWNTSTLTTDGTLRVSTVAVGPDTAPTNLVSSVSGGNLTLTWPSSHIGWTLQAQTNSRSVGLSNNWTAFDGGYATTNEAVIPIEKTSPTVFFRLFYQIP